MFSFGHGVTPGLGRFASLFWPNKKDIVDTNGHAADLYVGSIDVVVTSGDFEVGHR